LGQFRLAATPAGRIGGVRLQLAAREGVTRLAACYQQVPLRLMPPFQFGPSALLYLLNPTAGLMDRDGQLVELKVGKGADAVVVGQSATRIHPCLTGFATQQWHIQVEAGASLMLLPGPAIPFRGCRYYQRIEVDLASDARFALGDIWLAGRYARGRLSEKFQFKTVVQEVNIRREGRLVFRDRFCWRGSWSEGEARWHFGDALACGSCFFTGTVDEQQTSVQDHLVQADFPTAAGDTCLRWCGSSAAVTSAVVRAVAGSGRWLKEDELAPCHWFSRNAVIAGAGQAR
jgi:urease accessory protein